MSKSCEIVFNTKCGYCMTPTKCKSIADVIRLAKQMQLAFRIYVDGKCVKRGWYT